MKKLFLFVCFLFLQFAFGVKSLAYDFQVGDFCYTIISTTDKTVSVEAASKDLKGEVVIPSTVTYNDVEFSVTKIANEGFASCKDINTLTIPGSITSIDSYGLGWIWYLETLIFDNPQPISVASTGFNYDWRAFKTVKIINCNEKDILNTGLGFLTQLPSHELYINGVLIENYKVPDETETVGVLFANCTSLKTIEMPNTIKKIAALSFFNCTALNTVTLSSGLSEIEWDAFKECPELRTLYVKSTLPPYIYNTSFPNGAYMFANVYIPKGTLSDYQNANYWKNFANFIEKEYDDVSVPTKEKCATPTITYENGTIKFNSETEGVNYVSNITCADAGTFSVKDISISATYNITVYATKAGYDNSETTSASLCWIDQEPKTEGISSSVSQVRANAILIQNNGGNICIDGMADGELIEIYAINGEKRGGAISRNGVAQINTDLKSGDIGIVKINNKSVKVIIK